MWQSVGLPLAGWLVDVIPDWFGVMNVWTLLVPAALFFSVPDVVSLATMADGASLLPRGQYRSARWSAVCKTLVPARWRRLAMLPRKPVSSPGLLMTLMGLPSCRRWRRMPYQGQPV